jgi:predicted PurR-regulated permease PerM
MQPLGELTIGGFIGSLMLAYIITRIFYFLQKKLFSEIAKANSVILACFFFLTLATILGGYGFAIDDKPVFVEVFIRYLPAALIFLIFDLYRLKSTSTENEEISNEAIDNKDSISLTQSEKSFCSSCGKKIQSATKFCGGCGVAV